MAKRPVGPGGRYFEYRSGLGGFVWEGMATKIDPGGSPPSRPRWLQNVRIQGGSIISRPDFIGPGALIPGVTLYNTAGTDSTNPKNRVGFLIGTPASRPWDPHWAAEFNSVGGTRLWWGSTPGLTWNPPPEGQGWVATATGAIFGYLDTDSDPIFNTVGRYDSDDNWPPVVEKFNTEVYVGDFGCLRKVMLVQPPPGTQPANVLNTPADIIVLTFPGFRCTAMIEFQGKLWMVLTDPSATVNAEIWSYDGFVSNVEYTMTVSGETGAAIATYKNELIVTVNGFGSIIRRSAAGVWSTATVGGFDSSPYLNSMAQYRDKLMIMDGVDKIYSWNGTALALEHTISGTNPASGLASIPAYAYCCTVMNDVFYYGWTDINAIVPTLSTGGKIAYTLNPTAGQVVNIPTHATLGTLVSYQFVGSVFAKNQVKIEATADDTWTNLTNCINRAMVGAPDNQIGGKYYNPDGAHPLFSAAINTGTNEITLTTLIPGVSDNLDGAATYPGYPNNAKIVTTATGVTITDPTGGTGPSGQYVCLGRYDADNAANKWTDFWVRKYHIFRWGAAQLLPPIDDGGITAMNVYRGRIWVAVSGVPSGNSYIMTHSIQYAPYDGWFACDDTVGGDPDSAGWGQYIWQGYGPGHQNDFSVIYNQIAYLRSI